MRFLQMVGWILKWSCVMLGAFILVGVWAERLGALLAMSFVLLPLALTVTERVQEWRRQSDRRWPQSGD